MDKDELIDELERMDDASVNIIMALHIHGKLRFNELYKILREYGIEKSRPTIVDRLKHLVKRKWVIRKKEGKQNVSYRLNGDKAKALKTSPQEAEEMLKRVEKVFEKGGFVKVELPLSQMIKHLTRFFLEELRAELSFRLKHPSESEISNYLWFRKSRYKALKDDLIQKCVKNLSLRMEFDKAVDDILENVERKD